MIGYNFIRGINGTISRYYYFKLIPTIKFIQEGTSKTILKMLFPHNLLKRQLSYLNRN